METPELVKDTVKLVYLWHLNKKLFSKTKVNERI